MHAHEAHAAHLGVGEELVDAAEDVWPVFLSADLRVVLDPAGAAVGRRVDAAHADADLHLLRIVRVNGDRVQTHSAEAGHPLRP
jgi:hypothetical protein